MKINYMELYRILKKSLGKMVRIIAELLGRIKW